jgi:hypothetical protein
VKGLWWCREGHAVCFVLNFFQRKKVMKYDLLRPVCRGHLRQFCFAFNYLISWDASNESRKELIILTEWPCFPFKFSQACVWFSSNFSLFVALLLLLNRKSYEILFKLCWTRENSPTLTNGIFSMSSYWKSLCLGIFDGSLGDLDRKCLQFSLVKFKRC